MNTLRTLKIAIEQSSDTTLQTQYENLIDDLPLMDAQEIEAYASDLLSDTEYFQEQQQAWGAL